MKLPKMPKGKPTAKDAKAVLAFRGTVDAFARLMEIAVRCRKAGIDPVAALGLKPWQAPTVETMTEAQFATLEALLAGK
jgi:predicted metal-dependent TIM-barrel fold hydrolase